MRKTFYLSESDAKLFKKLRNYYEKELLQEHLIKVTDSLVLKWLIWYMIENIDPNKLTE